MNGGSQTVVVSYSGEDSDDDEESLDGRSHASWLMRSVFIFSRDDAIDEVLPRLFISGIVPATHMKVRAPLMRCADSSSLTHALARRRCARSASRTL